jgi:hypothetical protein
MIGEGSRKASEVTQSSTETREGTAVSMLVVIGETSRRERTYV